MILEEITAHADPEEGWKDIFLHLIEKNEDNDSVSFTCKGLYNGSTVGLKVSVKKNMVAGLLPSEEVNQDAFYRDGICFYSIGVESDNLLKALAELYEFPTDRSFLESVVGAMTFSLNQVDTDLFQEANFFFSIGLGPISLKNFSLFFSKDVTSYF